MTLAEMELRWAEDRAADLRATLDLLPLGAGAHVREALAVLDEEVSERCVDLADALFVRSLHAAP